MFSHFFFWSQLTLLGIHIETLDKELTLLKEQKEQTRQREAMLQAATWQPLDGDHSANKDGPPDPLSPQERLLSKYGAMVSFQEHVVCAHTCMHVCTLTQAS